MKKLLTLSVLAVAVALASGQTASAWSNIKFGVGMNLHWQTGDNNLLWGVFRSGQIPGPGPYGGGYDGFPMYYETAPGHAANKQPAVGAPAPATTATPGGVNQTGYGYYQPVGYYPNGYQVPMYTPNYYPQQVPSYWYGQ